MGEHSNLFEHSLHQHIPQNVNEVHQQELLSTFNDRLAVFITNKFGTVWAFYILIAWMIVWMILATADIWIFKNDKYPFSFLLFLSNLIQLWALPVLAFGQQVISRKAELQTNEQFEITKKMYHDEEQDILHLHKQDEELLKQTHLIEELLKQTQILQQIMENYARK